jgi:hypothetical protein
MIKCGSWLARNQKHCFQTLLTKQLSQFSASKYFKQQQFQIFQTTTLQLKLPATNMMISFTQALSVVGLLTFASFSVSAHVYQPLVCRMETLTIEMEGNVMDDMRFMCNAVADKDPYFIELPSDFTDSYPEFALGNTFISISNATIIEEGNGLQASILYPTDALISIVEAPSHRRLDENAESTHRTLGIRRALVVRVTSLDSEVSIDQETLSARIFGIGDQAEPINSVTQWRDCSAGSLQFLPAEDAAFTGGVYEMFLARNTSEKLETYYHSMHDLLTDELGSDLRERVDDIMICLPANSNTNGRGFIAFALGGPHFRSYYRDSACAGLTAGMHEVGHHMGLGHSGRLGQYDDLTGYMGYNAGGYPPMCFNANNHWYLKWFADRRVEVTTESSWTGKLAAFTDYDDTVEGEHVVLMKVGNYFLQYNRAEKHNAGTRQEQNKVTIVTRKSNGQTDLVASLRADTVTESSFFFAENFTGTGVTMVFEACAMVNSVPDYIMMNVYFANGTQNTLCGEQPSASPSVSPSLSALPSNLPSLTPSVSPSISTLPSNLPSLTPSISPTGLCENNPDATFSVDFGNLRGNLPRNCLWLARNKSYQSSLCTPTNDAYDLCAETCGACTDGCHDDPDFSIYLNVRIGEVGCDFFNKRPGDAAKWCLLRPGIAEACRDACNSCSFNENKVLDWYNHD